MYADFLFNSIAVEYDVLASWPYTEIIEFYRRIDKLYTIKKEAFDKKEKEATDGMKT